MGDGWQAVFRFVLAALAVWRLSHLIAVEEGPWRIFSRLRRGASQGLLGKLLSCVKCLSMWVGVPFAFFVGGTWWEMLVAWLALSGFSSLVDEWTRPPFEWREASGDELLRSESHRSAE